MTRLPPPARIRIRIRCAAASRNVSLVTWTIEEIQRDWGAEGSPGVTVEAFERVERLLGREWLMGTRRSGQWNLSGPSPLLRVVSAGQRLAALDAVSGAEKLLTKLRAGDRSADAELTAIHLLWSRDQFAELELEPPIDSSAHPRLADFRIRHADDDWTFVEVTRPTVSEARGKLEAILQRITDQVVGIRREFALEVFFRREPSDEELDPLIVEVVRLGMKGEFGQEEFGQDLALLVLSEVTPGQIVPHSEPEEPALARLGAASMIGGGGEPPRHIVARIPFADARADQFLDSEARQLPIDHPTLIMVDATDEPTAFGAWGPLVSRRFQPRLHTRVGGLCLFAPHLLAVGTSLVEVPAVQMHLNPHARYTIPSWILEAIADAGDTYKAVFAASGGEPTSG